MSNPPLLLFQPLLLFGTREYVEKGLACSPSGLFNFPLLFAPANCLEIVWQIRHFRGNSLDFWLFIEKRVYLAKHTRKNLARIQDRAWLNYFKNSVFILHLMFKLWINKSSLFRLMERLEINKLFVIVEKCSW